MATVEQIARVAHEANRGWCEANDDYSQNPWNLASQWQKDSAIAGVKVAVEGATPEEQHQAWCDHKVADGWVYGPVKDGEKKTHPQLVPYDELDETQKIKDDLYIAVVRALSD